MPVQTCPARGAKSRVGVLDGRWFKCALTRVLPNRNLTPARIGHCPKRTEWSPPGTEGCAGAGVPPGPRGGTESWRYHTMNKTLLLCTLLPVAWLAGCATCNDNLAQGHKQLIHRYFEEWANRGDPAAAEQLIATNVVLHNPPNVLHGLEEYKTRMAAFHSAFPDLRYTLEDQIAEGDKTVVRWTLRGTQTGEFQGHPASGRSFAITGVSLFRIAAGKIQEITVNMDRLGLMEQLGWLPAAPPPPK